MLGSVPNKKSQIGAEFYQLFVVETWRNILKSHNDQYVIVFTETTSLRVDDRNVMLRSSTLKLH